MTIQQQVVADLRVRASLLPREMQAWKEKTDRNVEGMGIHGRQVKAVNFFLEDLLAKQRSSLATFERTSTGADFAQKRLRVENVLTSSHGYAAIFRYMLTQRLDPAYRPALDAADRVAADCYLPIIAQAQRWGALSKDKYREPPLTYLHTAFSPLALTRRHYMNKVGLQTEGNLNRKLPIGIIALPFHQTVALWTFCSLYHEVGHLLDQDLGLRKAFKVLFQTRLKLNDSTHTAMWELWLPELIADTFGVLLGGAPFVGATVSLLFYPQIQVVAIDPTDPHPPNYLRVFVLGALLRATNIYALSKVADTTEQSWRELYPMSAELAPYVGECEAVAKTLLDERLLVALKNYSLRELAPPLAEHHQRIIALGEYLRMGEGDMPATQLFPIRLLPAAAQYAVDNVAVPDELSYNTIHQRSLSFIEAIPRPKYMDIDDFPATRRAYLRSLVQELDLETLEE